MMYAKKNILLILYNSYGNKTKRKPDLHGFAPVAKFFSHQLIIERV